MEVKFSQATVEGTTAELSDLKDSQYKRNESSAHFLNFKNHPDAEIHKDLGKPTLLLFSHSSLRRWNLDKSGTLVSFLFRKIAQMCNLRLKLLLFVKLCSSMDLSSPSSYSESHRLICIKQKKKTSYFVARLSWQTSTSLLIPLFWRQFLMSFV